MLLALLIFTLVGSAFPADDEVSELPVEGPDVGVSKLTIGMTKFAITTITATTEARAAPCPWPCKKTCTRPNPSSCVPNPTCSCQSGYVFASALSNTCIPIYQCPTNAGCNGDPNAEIQTPVIACPSTCRTPNQSNCNKKNLPVGCVCKSGYILSRPGGRCIRPRNCPRGNPCRGGNRTYVNCKVVCPINYCPVDDSDTYYPCDPIWPCPAGCVCKSGYRLANGQCVLPEDCPPVQCTRPNEEFDGCPPPCYTDNCYDVPNWSQPCDNNDPFLCQPKCRCIDGFARGNDGICIPVDQCPP